MRVIDMEFRNVFVTCRELSLGYILMNRPPYCLKATWGCPVIVIIVRLTAVVAH